MLQMTSMFQNQNSSIVDALEHWRKNMDRQFEGLESCMICFSVVSHSVMYQFDFLSVIRLFSRSKLTVYIIHFTFVKLNCSKIPLCI